jgi:DNA-binding MarR family transcriptional regulator
MVTTPPRDIRDAAGPDLDRKLLAAVERLGRALRAARQQIATRHGLSLLGMVIVEMLTDGRPRLVGEIAAELDITQPTASDALATLEKRGHIRRQRDPADLRRTVIHLTETGTQMASAIVEELGPLIDGSATSPEARGVALRVILGEIARLQTAGIITINRSCLSCHHYRPSEPTAPAHCLLLDTPLPDPALRLDCPEHQPADA